MEEIFHVVRESGELGLRNHRLLALAEGLEEKKFISRLAKWHCGRSESTTTRTGPLAE
jgi:hypothetical protein